MELDHGKTRRDNFAVDLVENGTECSPPVSAAGRSGKRRVQQVKGEGLFAVDKVGSQRSSELGALLPERAGCVVTRVPQKHDDRCGVYVAAVRDGHSLGSKDMFKVPYAAGELVPGLDVRSVVSKYVRRAVCERGPRVCDSARSASPVICAESSAALTHHHGRRNRSRSRRLVPASRASQRRDEDLPGTAHPLPPQNLPTACDNGCGRWRGTSRGSCPVVRESASARAARGAVLSITRPRPGGFRP